MGGPSPHECGGCKAVEIFSTAEIHVTVAVGDERALAAGTLVCVRCGLIQGEPAIKVSEDDRRRLHGLHVVGRSGTADSLGLPDWGNALLDYNGPSVAPRLLSGYKALTRQDIVGRIMTSNGGNLARLPVACPTGVPPMQITREVVAHIVQDGDRNHILYAPLIRDVLEDPMEVWRRDVDGKPDQVHFLKKFAEGGKEITVMVVGDQDGGFLRTGYCLKGPKQAQNKREGTLLHLKWR